MGWSLELLEGGQIALSVRREELGSRLQHRLTVYGCISDMLGFPELKGRAVDVVLYLNDEELADFAAEAAKRARAPRMEAIEEQASKPERGGTHGEESE